MTIQPNPGESRRLDLSRKDLLVQKKAALGESSEIKTEDMLRKATTSQAVRRIPRPTGLGAQTLSSNMKQKMVAGVRMAADKPLPAHDSGDRIASSSEMAASSSNDKVDRLSGRDEFTISTTKSTGSLPLVSKRVSETLSGHRPHHLKEDCLPWISNIFRAGKKGNQYINQKFLDMIQKSANFTPEQKEALRDLAAVERDQSERSLLREFQVQTDRPEFRENAQQPLLPDKEATAMFKEMTKDIQSVVQKHIRDTAAQYSHSAMNPALGLTNEAKDELHSFAKDIQADAKNIEGSSRFAVIHEQPEWDPDKGIRSFMGFVNPDNGRHVKVESSFRAMGPGYSSQAPRNRTAATAYVPNYFETRMFMEDKGDGSGSNLESVLGLSATRSAITNEFSQPDATVRKQTNAKLVRQIVQGHARRKLTKMNWEQLQIARDPESPVVLKSQTVNLLTPDRLRSFASESESFRNLAGKLHQGLSGSPADDERTLAMENLEAYKALDGRTVGVDVESSKGEKMTVYVKYDLRYFNIPNNVMYEKVPKFLTMSEELKAEKDNSWKQLEGDVRKQHDQLRFQFDNQLKNVKPEEKEWLERAQGVRRELVASRERIMLKTIDDESTSSTSKDFRRWQVRADNLATYILDMRKNPELSPQMARALDLLEADAKLLMLYLDTRELYLSGMSSDVQNMDNNRSALATRVIALGMIVDDVDVHFGCRSGKDRTGLVDIEVKLLLTTSVLTGRISSYREQERVSRMTDWREQMTLESGNVDELIKANMGARIGINTGGSASKPFESADESTQLQHQEFTQAAQAYAKAASRPSTNWQIPSSHEDHFRNLPIVITR